MTHDSATIAFETDRQIIARVIADGRTFSDSTPTTRHEIELGRLPAASQIDCTVRAGQH